MLALACAAVILAGCPGAGRAGTTPFDGERALGYVRQQLAFGPRIPGTDGHRRTGDWIIEHMRARADTVIVQEWKHVTQAGDTLPLRNILARFRPEAEARVLYLAHWDTRPISDAALDRAQRRLPVPGANDGASGTALLMEVANVLAAHPPQYGVDLLFVDGEDYGDFARDRDVLMGSRHFAENLPSPDYRPIFGVLWDMIGDADLQIYHEGYSVQSAPEVVMRVWQTAERLGYSEHFIDRGKHTVMDDHVPLLRKGLRVIDVIDFDYDHHHKPTDTLDKVSARSLKIVGDVAVALVREEE